MNKKFIAILVSVFAVVGIVIIAGRARADTLNPKTINVGPLNGSINGSISGTLTVGNNDTASTSSLIGTFPAVVTGISDGTYSISGDHLRFTPDKSGLPPYTSEQAFNGTITLDKGVVTLQGTLNPGFKTDSDGDTHDVTSVNASFSNGMGTIKITTTINYGTAENPVVVNWTVEGEVNTNSIQAAINAASSGDTINVAAGNYKEQLVIDKSLTLQGTGAGTTIIEAPDTMAATTWTHRRTAFQTLIEVNGTSAHGITVNISGFTIDGLNKSSADPRYTGIVYHNANGTISNNTITKFGNNPPKGADGWGIFVVEGSNVTISNNTVDKWGKGGIVVDGDNDYTSTDVTATITGNIITGAGEITAVAQNGIQISRGATGTVSKNTVNGNYYDGSDWSGSGILLYYSKNVLVSENTLTGNQTGIYINGDSTTYPPDTYTTDGSQIIDNDIKDGKYGIAILHTKDTTITGNTISGNTASGFRLRADETNTIIRGNNITRNNTSDAATAGGILIEKDANADQITANFNNIVGNKQYGIFNGSTTDTVNATNNWWGDKSGPGGVGSGLGDAVSDNVNYDPWIGAEIENSKTDSVTDGTLDAKTEANTEIVVTGGTATVTAAKYSGNPGTGFTGDIGKYIDVYVSPDSTAAGIEIRLYYADSEISGKDESSLKLYWWNDTAWSPCSDSGVDTASNYIWAKIRSDTTPNLTQLTGTAFGGSGSPLVTTGGGGGGGVIDITPPVISDIKVEAHSDKAIVSWTTDESAISWVAYGTIPNYGNEFQDNNYVTSHTVTLSFLSPQTTYYYQVKARDRAGNVSSSSGATFTTLSPGEVLGASTEAMTLEDLMAKVNEIKAQIQKLQNKLAQLTGKVVLGAATYEGIPQDFSFKTNLKEGDSSNDVKYLQIILKAEIGAPTYPENVPATGWFGPITKAAVIKFQEKYASEILAPWNLTKGTGLVANTTRAKLNQMLGH